MIRENTSEGDFIEEFTKEMIGITRIKIEDEKNKPKKNIIKVEEKKLVEKPERKPVQVIQPLIKPMVLQIQPTQIQKPIPIQPISKPLSQSMSIVPVPKPVSQTITPVVKPVSAPTNPPIKPSPIIEKQVSKEIVAKNMPAVPKPQLRPGEIDFGKILPLIRDQLITSIECPGVNKNIVIKKAGNIIKTQIILEKQEILSIIKIFYEKANIPLVEGMLVARIDNLELSGVIPTSSSASPSFMIKREPVIIENKLPSQLMKPLMQTTPLQLPRQIPFTPPANPQSISKSFVK